MSTRSRDKPSEEQVQRMLAELEEAAGSKQHERVLALADELWASRRSAVPVLAERLASGQSAAPLLLLELLPTFAGRSARQQLSKIARDTRATDLTRFSARRRMGWAERGEAKARLTFLGSLQDGVATLTEALESLRDVPYPLSGETMEEVLKFLLVMPPAQAREVVTLGVRLAGRRVNWLLRALLHAPDPSMRTLAEDAILEVSDVGAIAAMKRAARSSEDSGVSLRALDAVRRLRSEQDTRSSESVAEPVSIPPFHSAYLSAIDGSGGQVAVAVRQLRENVLAVAQFFFQDGWGVKDTIGLGTMPWESVEDLYDTWDDRLDGLKGEREGQEIPLVEVVPSALRGALAQAERLNAESNHPFPREFEIWEPFLHEKDPPPPDEPIVVPELDDAGYSGRNDLYRRSAELLDHRFFQSWTFEPRKLARVLATDISLPVRGKLTERHLRQITSALMDDVTRAELRVRLRRQAWLLREVGDEEEAEIALAAAAGLSEGDPSGLARHPLLQRMVLFGLAPLMGFHILSP